MSQRRNSKALWIVITTAATASTVAVAQTPSPSQAPAPARPPAAQSAPSQSANSAATPSAMAAGSGRVSAADKKFMQDAAQGGMAEVQEGQMAARKASDPQVKQFAEKMVADHSSANDKLKQIAASKNVALPADIPASAKRENGKLSQMSGPAFDREYIKQQVSEHKKVAAEFKAATKRTRDPDVKQFAQETLPTIEQHLDMAKGITTSSK